MTTRRLVVVGAGLLAALVAGCSSGPGLAAAGSLRFLHFSPDTGAVEFRRDGVPMTSLTANGGATLAAGSASLEVFVNPQAAHYAGLVAGQSLFDLELTLDPTKRMYALLGKQSPGDGEPAFEVREYPYNDTLAAGTELGTAGTAGIRFLQAAINAGPVSLVLVTEPEEPAVEGATPTTNVVAEGVLFGQITGLDGSLSRPIEVPVEGRPSRIEARGPEDQVLALATHTCEAGQVANVALINRGNRLELLIF